MSNYGGMRGSRERVEERLSGLQVVYGSFPVDQTTISVPETQFERFYQPLAEPIVGARIEVYNQNDEVLYLPDHRGQRLAATGVGLGEKIERRS